ncbi:MAG TPA: hypothetical protein VD932_03760 [Aquabacterium sp.]|nr:hypothetical protein [Aquabacterium sp.]
MDYFHGRFETSEHYHARLDEAAREREPEFEALLQPAPVTEEEYGATLMPQIQALPPRLRQYFHDLHTRVDPAGDLRRAFLAEERVEELTAKCNRYQMMHRVAEDQLNAQIAKTKEALAKAAESQERERQLREALQDATDWIQSFANGASRPPKDGRKVLRAARAALSQPHGSSRE